MSGLLRSELLRLRSRRFVVVLLLLALTGFGVGVAIAAAKHHRLTPAQLQVGQQRVTQLIAEQQAGREQCVQQLPPGQEADQFCGPAPDLSGFRAEDFTDTRPFVLVGQLPDGVLGIGVITAVLLFVIGATWVGAEWSTRSMVALLFWEPRRTRVVLTKLGVLVGAAVVVGVVAQALWFGAAQLLAGTRGTRGGLPPHFYGDLAQTQGRVVLFGVLVAAMGFALANLVRNTGAAMGIAFAYLIVVENAVRALWPRGQEWLLTTNAQALIDPAGARYFLQGARNTDGSYGPGREVVLSHLHGGLVLGCVATLVVLVGGVLFVRRDLN